jgi:hypothetical protein
MRRSLRFWGTPLIEPKELEIEGFSSNPPTVVTTVNAAFGKTLIWSKKKGSRWRIRGDEKDHRPESG